MYILLVEDDRPLGEGIQFALSTEGYDTRLVDTLAQARAAIGERLPDLLLLDIILPDGTGHELCKQVRPCGVPVIFLTSCDDELDVIRGLEGGGDDYITKPFRVRELLSRIRAVLRRTHQELGTTMGGGSVTLDALTGRVTRNGQEVIVTPLEYRLLLHLMRHPGQVLTRDQLLRALWDDGGEFVDDNTLSVNIRRLRGKIEEDASFPARIVTVRGIGYRWEGE